MAGLTPSARRVILVSMALVAAASPALAQDFSPIDNFFTTVGTALTTTTGRAIGLVIIAVIGFRFATGKLDFAYAASGALGLVIVFGAATILSGF